MFTASQLAFASLAANIATATRANGGATFALSGQSLTGRRGYALSVYPDRERIVPGVADAASIAQYIADNADVFLSDLRAVVGTWVHDGQTFLDISRVIADRSEALAAARDAAQLAIFDLEALEEITVSGAEAAA